MALAVDASSPARVSDNSGAATAVVTASFTPPSGSLLVTVVHSDSAANTAQTFTITDSLSGTWPGTPTVKFDGSDWVGAFGGGVYVFVRTTLGAGSSMTVTTTRTAGDGGKCISSKTYVITGQAASPIGATAKNSQTSTASWTPAGPTTTAANSLVIGGFTDWLASASPTSSDLTSDSSVQTGSITLLSGYKAVVSAGATTMNFSTSTTGNDSFAAVEVLAAAAGGTSYVPLGTYTPGTVAHKNQPGRR